MPATAIIVAGGSGTRLPGGVPKQLAAVGGTPILALTIQKFQESPDVDDIIVVMKADWLEAARKEAIDSRGFSKVSAVVAGGETRQRSVAAGLLAMKPGTDVALIHDAVRPFVTAEQIAAVVRGAQEHRCCALAVPVVDTLRRADENLVAGETIDRGGVWRMQTPQGFAASAILHAYQKCDQAGITGLTDDCAAVSAAGFSVKLVPGSPRNIKITTPDDLIFAEAIYNAQKAETVQKPEKRAETAVEPVLLYTDGACSGNPGKGGYGAILVYKGARKEFSGGFKLTTNNRMELMAVIAGLEALKKPSTVVCTSDSKYVVDAVTKGWARNWRAKGWRRNKNEAAVNPDLWERLLNLLDIHRVDFVWVKGHAGHPENERCDFLAREATNLDILTNDAGYVSEFC